MGHIAMQWQHSMEYVSSFGMQADISEAHFLILLTLSVSSFFALIGMHMCGVFPCHLQFTY